jgi:hypothetical protein
MPRHAPRSPQEESVRHLLRNLDDASALRTNPLVAPLFIGTGRAHRAAGQSTVGLVREVVEHTVASLVETGECDAQRAMRFREILWRCDLRDESHAIVARSLGLSLRQFYRERRAACLHLEAPLASEVRARCAGRAVVADPAAIELARGRMLHECGESSRAAKVLAELVRAAGDPESKMTAWSALVDVFVESNSAAQAHREVELQRSYVATLERRTRYRLEAIIDAERALLLWQSGNEREAMERDERIDRQIGSLGIAPERAERELAAKIRLQASDRAWLAGSYRRARALVDEAYSIVRSLEPVPPVLHVTALNAFAQVTEMSTESTDAARTAFEQALAFAQAYGLSGQASLATIGLSVTAQLAGDVQASRAQLQGLLAIADRLSPARRGELYIRAAELEALTGHTKTALAYARRARACYPQGSLESSLPMLSQAQAYLATGAYLAARRAATRASRCGSENGRFRGTALRLLAESYWGLRDRNAATEAIRESIAELERYGHPFSLHKAYAASAKITGDANHRRHAREIANLLARHSTE